MVHVEIADLKVGSIIDNNELTSLFLVGSQGGMRRSLKTNTLVLISDHTKGIYEDFWTDDVLHYTGMGLEGDQNLNFMQNKTISESPKNKIIMHLFEVYIPKKYIYCGEVLLAGTPYKDNQYDRNGNLRTVWIFPLRRKESSSEYTVPESHLKENMNQKEKKLKNLTLEQLVQQRETTGKRENKTKINSSTTVFLRDPVVSEIAKRLAEGVCQLCGLEGPFRYRSGEVYLETHHIVWLSKGGDDTIENTIALCPNCHRRMHILNNKVDIGKLVKRNSILRKKLK